MINSTRLPKICLLSINIIRTGSSSLELSVECPPPLHIDLRLPDIPFKNSLLCSFRYPYCISSSDDNKSLAGIISLVSDLFSLFYRASSGSSSFARRLLEQLSKIHSLSLSRRLTIDNELVEGLLLYLVLRFLLLVLNDYTVLNDMRS
jgi:hypothetical protein